MYFALLTDAVCSLENYKKLFMERPICEDEIEKLYEVSIALAEPYDLGTIADSDAFWVMCKGEPTSTPC